MKKKSLLILFTAVASYIVISGYREGPASYNGYDCTGAETGLGNFAGCGGTSGCHSTSPTAGIAVTVVLDSVGKPTTHYVGGKTYTVVITGTNNTTNSLPGYGFQLGSIKGSTAVTTPTNEGTWGAPYPTNVHFATPNAYFVVKIVEHGVVLSPTTGSGGKGSTYKQTLNWTAPAKGTGTVSIWGTLQAVNNNGTNDAGDLWNNKVLVLNEWPITTGVEQVEQNALNMNIFPNPATNNTTLNYTLAETANVQVGMYDIAGQKVYEMNYGEQTAGEHQQQINLLGLNLRSGIYFVVINQGDNVSTKKLIVQ